MQGACAGCPSSTATLKMGLCLGPVFSINLYCGSFLNIFKEYSWSFVLESIINLLLSFKSFLQKNKIRKRL